MSVKAVRFTKEMKDYFWQHYPYMGQEQFTRNFNALFGTNYKEKSSWARSTANRLGVSSDKAPPGWYKLSELAYLFGVRKEVFQEKAEAGTMAAKKFGSRWYVDEDEVERQKQFYDSKRIKPPWPAMTVQQAAKRLGINPDPFRRLIRAGYVSSVKCGKIYLVKKAHVEWGYNQMLKHGFTKIPWYKMKERMGNEF